MHIQHLKQVRLYAMIFVGIIIGTSILLDMYVLTLISICTGILVMGLTKPKTRIDEREKTIREKAAQFAYAVFAPTMGITSFLLLIPSYSGLAVFSRGKFAYIESLGMILAYLTLFLIAVYAVSYYFFSRRYGGGSNEE